MRRARVAGAAGIGPPGVQLAALPKSAECQRSGVTRMMMSSPRDWRRGMCRHLRRNGPRSRALQLLTLASARAWSRSPRGRPRPGMAPCSGPQSRSPLSPRRSWPRDYGRSTHRGTVLSLTAEPRIQVSEHVSWDSVFGPHQLKTLPGVTLVLVTPSRGIRSACYQLS